ncbi:hypothetical protein NW752_003019 [Fusarium irregulare]|nr:hypothetical protein NW752_003019 [Fusarium irregulare]
MEEKLIQLQRNGLCDQRICAAISNLIEDLIWELPLAASKSLTRRRVKRNILPKRENNAKKPAAKRTSTKELARKASAATARPTQDTFAQLEQKYRDIKQEKDNQDTLLTQLQRQYGDLKQEKDAADQLIELLQRRLEDSDRVLQELQKEITESKRKDLEIYFLRGDLLETEKKLQESRSREAEWQKAMGDNIHGIEIPTTLPVQPSYETIASPELEFLSQTEINSSRNDPERSTLVSWHLETISDDLAIWNGPTTGHALELVADPSPYIAASSSPTPCIPTSTNPTSEEKDG